MTANKSRTAPTLAPPQDPDAAVDAPGRSEPAAITDADIAALVADSTPLAGPTVTPAARAESDQAVTATWHSSVTIDALWSIDETRNAWVRVVGLGWRKLYNGRDGAFQALTTLAGQARQTNRPVTLREEADGMIYELYLW